MQNFKYQKSSNCLRDKIKIKDVNEFGAIFELFWFLEELSEDILKA